MIRVKYWSHSRQCWWFNSFFCRGGAQSIVACGVGCAGRGWITGCSGREKVDARTFLTGCMVHRFRKLTLIDIYIFSCGTEGGGVGVGGVRRAGEGGEGGVPSLSEAIFIVGSV